MLKVSGAMVLVILSVLVLSSCNNEKKDNSEVLNSINNEIETVSTGTVETSNTGTSEVSPVKAPETTSVQTGATSEVASGTTAQSVSTPKVVNIPKKYNVPSGQDEVSFAITLDGEKISDVKVNIVKGDEETKEYVEKFLKAVNKEIVGKTVAQASDIKIVGGASLTTQAFIDVVKSTNFGVN